MTTIESGSQTTSSTPIVAAKGVGKTYQLPDRELAVLEDISFGVRSGELVTIVGASGCGKSTLLKLLAGLIDTTTGTIEVDGTEMGGPRPETVGVVFQEDALLPWYRIEANIGLGLAARGVDKRERKERVHGLLDTVGLNGFEDAYPHELSGGMRQRAALARALVLEPRVLLLDEPFAALDEQTRNLMGQELRSLHDKVGGAMIMVTHSLTEAVLLSDRVLAISSRPGRLRKELPITLPEHRSVDLIDTTAFTELRSRLWKELEEEWTRSWNARSG